MRARGLGALLLAILLALPAMGAEHDKRSAAAHFKNGRALYADGRFADALDQFQAGYQAYPLVGFLVNIGQCQRKLGELDAAAGSFQKFLASDPPEELRGEVTDALAEVRGEIARRDQAESQRRTAQASAAPRDATSTGLTPVPELTDAPPAARAPSAAAPVEPAPAPAASVETAPALALSATPPPPPTVHKKSRAWVWALVGIAAAGAAAAGVAVGVIETATPRGSFGVIDGRR